MEMHQIRYVLAVCRTRNFTRGARACGVSQPSLTKAIKALELELGGRLFHRDRRGVQLTGMGARLRPHFEQIARLVVTIREDMPDQMTDPAADLWARLGRDGPLLDGRSTPTYHDEGHDALDRPAE